MTTAHDDDDDGAPRSELTEAQVDASFDAQMRAGQPLQAAEAVVTWLLRQPVPLSAVNRARALKAGEIFEAHAGYVRGCEVFVWVGEHERASRLAMRASTMAPTIDAAACLTRIGDVTHAVPLLLKTKRTDASYARACVEIARALGRGAAVTMEIDRFLANFLRRGPDDAVQADALYLVAAAFAREGFVENAIEALMAIETRRPGFRDAAAQAQRMMQARRGAVQDFARVLDDDANFHGRREPSAAVHAPAHVSRIIDALAPSTATDESAALALESFAPGVMLAKRYRIEELIGRGGMSLVYRATDVELKDVVALKIFTQPTNDDALARFKQEVLLARQLLHKNIVRVYDLGTALGARFLTMELLRGEDLHTKLVRGVTLREGLDLMIQACAGLEVAHQAGVVHRDIKPENLFVTNDNVLKVTDFGIAKQLNSEGLTVAGMVVGTPEYMAPEQAHGHMKVTPQADLYSLGVIFYFLTTGSLPFRHAELVPLLMMHVSQIPESPRLRNPSVHPDVDGLVMQLLQKDPALRPPSARALGERLIDLRLRGVV